MNRRGVLVAFTGVYSTLVAGCLAVETAGRTYRLRFADVGDAREREGDVVLDFNRVGLTPAQKEILVTAREEGEYVEADVSWTTMPRPNAISPAFQSLIDRIARHVGHEGSLTEGTSFETACQFERSDCIVTVEVIQ